ncbi:hypothetical protein [Natrinema versiforme]|uniref:hypothetical protein n=1 Tax=Natrinema versiforme TaxID=88724 RepID=UPI001268C192|nr:hypothetical protein [Natrinema versiforme]
MVIRKNNGRALRLSYMVNIDKSDTVRKADNFLNSVISGVVGGSIVAVYSENGIRSFAVNHPIAITIFLIMLGSSGIFAIKMITKASLSDGRVEDTNSRRGGINSANITWHATSSDNSNLKVLSNDSEEEVSVYIEMNE